MALEGGRERKGGRHEITLTLLPPSLWPRRPYLRSPRRVQFFPIFPRENSRSENSSFLGTAGAERLGSVHDGGFVVAEAREGGE